MPECYQFISSEANAGLNPPGKQDHRKRGSSPATNLSIASLLPQQHDDNGVPDLLRYDTDACHGRMLTSEQFVRYPPLFTTRQRINLPSRPLKDAVTIFRGSHLHCRRQIARGELRGESLERSQIQPKQHLVADLRRVLGVEILICQSRAKRPHRRFNERRSLPLV